MCMCHMSQQSDTVSGVRDTSAVVLSSPSKHIESRSMPGYQMQVKACLL